MPEHTSGGRLTRRVVLAMAAAVPTVLLPAAAAEARRRPPLGDSPYIRLASTAQTVTTPTGVPGLRLTLSFDEPENDIEYRFSDLIVDSTLIRDIEPQLIIVTQHQHNVVVVSPVTATGSVQISFQYTRDTDPALRYGPVKITVLPGQAAPKPPKPPKPPHGLPA